MPLRKTSLVKLAILCFKNTPCKKLLNPVVVKRPFSMIMMMINLGIGTLPLVHGNRCFFWKLLSHHVSLSEFLPIVIAFEFWVHLPSVTTHPTSLNKFIMLIMCIFVLKPLFILGVRVNTMNRNSLSTRQSQKDGLLEHLTSTWFQIIEMECVG